MTLTKKKADDVLGVVLGIILCEETGRIILVENIIHKTPMKRIPGGRREFGETAEGALMREIREETLLEVRIGDVNFLFKHTHPVHRHPFLIFACTIENFDGMSTKPIQDGDSLLVAQAYTLEQVIGMINGDTRNGNLVPIHRKMLDMGIQIIDAIIND